MVPLDQFHTALTWNKPHKPKPMNSYLNNGIIKTFPERKYLQWLHRQLNINSNSDAEQDGSSSSGQGSITGVPESHIFLKDLCDHIYCLRFKSINATIALIKVSRDDIPPREDERATQTYCKEHYVSKAFQEHTRIWLYVREDRPLRKKKAKPKTVPPKKNAQKKAISEPEKFHYSSTIYIEVLDMTMRIKLPQFMTFESIKAMNDESPSYLYSNKITTYAICKNELVKVQLDMQEPSLDRIIKKSEKCTETVDKDLVYYRHVSDFHENRRFVYCGLPRTTYYYRDPMIEVRKENWRRSVHKKEPLWMIQRRNRNALERKKREKEEFIKKCERRGGTAICAEIAGIMIRARCGVTEMTIRRGASFFDEWAAARRNSKPSEGHVRQNPETCTACSHLKVCTQGLSKKDVATS